MAGFTLKLHDATEWKVKISDQMMTLKDLRNLVSHPTTSDEYPGWGVPITFQSFICHGKTYDPEYNGEYPLTEMTGCEEMEPSRECIVWLCWMADHNYWNAYGGFVMQGGEAEARQACGARVELITIKAFKYLRRRIMSNARYEQRIEDLRALTWMSTFQAEVE